MQKGTGGGPNMEKVLSPLEEAIFKLIGIKQSVEGLAVKQFGIQENLDMSCEENCREVESLNLTQTGTLDGFMDISGVSPISPPVVSVDSLAFTNEDPSADKSEVASSSKKAYSSQKASKKESSLCALEEEIKIQREISANIKTAVTNQDEQRENLKKIYQRLDKLYELKKKHFKAIEAIKKEKLEEIKIANAIKREKLEENKRHNYVMEQMRRKEI